MLKFFRWPRDPKADESIDTFVLDSGDILLGAGGKVSLSKSEATVLTILIDRSPKFTSWQELARAVYGASEGPQGESNMISQFICRMSKKLAGRSTLSIVSKHGHGWRLYGEIKVDRD